MKLYLFQNQGFLIFAGLLFALYWLVPSKWRNRVLLLGSYVFYGSWDYRFLGVLWLSTVVDYFCANAIAASKQSARRKLYLSISVTLNLVLLGYFKYFNFFVESFVDLLKLCGVDASFTPWNIILPLGISFYTFQALGYMIDVYRSRFKPVRNFFDYALFVAYFPQIIAGPIQRAADLIPALLKEKKFRQVEFEKAVYLFIYGIFKKVVLADSLALIVNRTFGEASPSASHTVFAAYGYALQMYCDFSGYSDMARGVSLLFGICIAKNFEWPFLTHEPSAFWRRWHMTLSAWVRDYLYSPLLIKTRSPYFSIFVAYLVIGFWHGPRWTYFLFGPYWFLLTVLYRWALLPFPKVKTGAVVKALLCILFFQFVSLGFLLFRSNDMAQFFSLVRGLGGEGEWQLWNPDYGILYLSMAFLLVYELFQALNKDEFALLKKSFYVKTAFYALLIFLHRQFGGAADLDFIYFQF